MGKLLERITYKITKNGCWEVTSHKARGAGYPRIRIGGRKGKLWLIHRLVYTELVEDIPEGLLVLHNCDNRECINPEHLRVGTYSDNYNDWVSRGENSYKFTHHDNRPPILRGENATKNKLTENQVRRIRRLLEEGKTLRFLGKKFKVNHKTISDIKLKKSWSWLE